MNRFLPSKKLLVFLGITLMVLGCFVLFFKFKNNKVTYFLSNESEEEIIKMVSEINQQTLKNDSDGDGLKDWEEILWKTDPQNPDTDGDGVDDNTEILAKRNPLIAGPDDLLSENITTFINTQDDLEYDKPLTQTDILSRELFTGYVALKQNNQLGAAQEEQFISNLVIKSLSPNTILVKNYTIDDLNISNENNDEIIQQYADRLMAIIKLGDNLEDEAVLIKTIVETKSKSELKKLNSNIEIYKEMQEQLLSLKTPLIISSIHLKGINSLGNLINDVSNMLLIFEDPVAGLKGVENYFDSLLSLSTNIIYTIDYFNKNNITFDL